MRPPAIKALLRHLPGILSIYSRLPRWVMRCDLARLVHVFMNGGFYCDVDCLLTAPLPSAGFAPTTLHLYTESVVRPSSLGPREDKSPARRVRIANYLFGCSCPHHPLLWDAIVESARRTYHLLEVERVQPASLTDSDVLWATGPDVITSVYHDRSGADIAAWPVVLHPPGTHRHLRAGSWRTAPAPARKPRAEIYDARTSPNKESSAIPL